MFVKSSLWLPYTNKTCMYDSKKILLLHHLYFLIRRNSKDSKVSNTTACMCPAHINEQGPARVSKQKQSHAAFFN